MFQSLGNRLADEYANDGAALHGDFAAFRCWWRRSSRVRAQCEQTSNDPAQCPALVLAHCSRGSTASTAWWMGLGGRAQGRCSGRTLGLGRASSQTRPQLPIFTPQLRPAIAKFRKSVWQFFSHGASDPANSLRPALRRDPADEFHAKIRAKITHSKCWWGLSDEICLLSTRPDVHWVRPCSKAASAARWLYLTGRGRPWTGPSAESKPLVHCFGVVSFATSQPPLGLRAASWASLQRNRSHLAKGKE